MLMMLASWGQVVQVGQADAGDNGFLAPSAPNRPG